MWSRLTGPARSAVRHLAPDVPHLPQTGIAQWGFTLRVKELDAGRNSARDGGAGPSFRRSRCGFARIPLRSLAMLSLSLWCGERSTRWGGLCAPCNPRCFRRRAMLSLWSARPLLVSSVRLRAATAHAVGRPYSFFWGGHLGCRAVGWRGTQWGGLFWGPLAHAVGAASSGLFWLLPGSCVRGRAAVGRLLRGT